MTIYDNRLYRAHNNSPCVPLWRVLVEFVLFVFLATAIAVTVDLLTNPLTLTQYAITIACSMIISARLTFRAG